MTAPAHPEVIRVSTAADPRLAAFRDLTDVDMRRTLEPDTGIFMAEGLLVIERVVAAGLAIESVLTAPKWLDRLGECLGDWPGPTYVLEEEQLRDLTGYRVHRGALACVRRPPERDVDDISRRPGDILVLGDLVDHTNVGLAIRSATAMGITGVVLSPRCADPLYRRAIKLSMGAVITTPWARSREWPVSSSDLAGRPLVALTPDPTAPALDVALRSCAGDVALVAGGEGPGLSADEQAMCDVRARIPMESGIDSLNVAAAVAVACYALRMWRSS